MPTPPPADHNDLLLKVTPPRVPRHLVPRAGLAVQRTVTRDQPVVLVQAPAGFGKTSLLAHWRLDLLARGAAVAWLSAGAPDSPRRLVHSLCLAVRIGAGRPNFGHVLLEPGAASGLEAITEWLAEVAQSALDLVLVVDEAERLPPDSRDALAYLLRNTPANLRCVVAARPDCDLGLADLAAYGQCIRIGAPHLRFGLSETLDLVRARCGDRVGRDEAARLHDMTEGWPLGLQLALTVAESAGASALPRLDLHGGALREQFVGFLLRNLPAPDLDFLVRVAVVDHLHPDLAEALVPGVDAAARLARLVRDTPVFIAGEQSDWVRLHSLARDALRVRLEGLATAERQRVHAAAADWLAAHAMLDAAAGHALAAGRPQQAYDLVERSVYQSLMQRGRQAEVLDWLERMPADELDRRPRFLLAAAWSLATSQRHAEAGRLVERILAQPESDAAVRFECSLILGGAATFADDADRFAELHDPWAAAPQLPTHDPVLLQVHANRCAFRALLDGEPALARLLQQQAPRSAAGHLDRWGDLIVSLSYIWQGQVVLADSLLRPALAAAEADLGRRSPFASMLAALLAAVCWERDQPEEAQAILANRLDVVERTALPECVQLGFRTLARIAAATGAEHQAAELLLALDAVGIARRLPRLRVISLAEQVRMHARRYRGVSCRELAERLDALLADPAMPQGPLWRRGVAMHQAMAHGYALIAAQDWRRALQPLEQAEAIAQRNRQGRLRIELLGLRALALDRCGERSQPLLREALGLADALGLRRVFADAHPALGDWVRQAGEALPAQPAARAAAVPQAPRATPSMVLTPKEREVLELLARNLSNKEVALALQVGEETVKWHVKNLFAKLDAGTRKQVVSRARMLGLLADA